MRKGISSCFGSQIKGLHGGSGNTGGYYPIATIYDQNRQEVRYDQISPYALDAAVARLVETNLLVGRHLHLAIEDAAAQLRALADLESRPASPQRPPVHPDVPDSPRRPLGRTGLLVSPLALSGAHELTSGALAQARQAGVNLFFTSTAHAS